MDELIQQNELLLKENDFLISFIERYENDDELDMNDNVDEDFDPTLNAQMKLAIAQLENQNLEKEKVQLNNKFLEAAIMQKSLILATEQKLAQLRRLMFQFQREVLNDQQLTGNFTIDEEGVERIVHQLPKSVGANTLQSYYTKQTNALGVQKEQLAKNLQAQQDKYNRLEKQLSRPQANTQTITQIDFEQLKIENDKLQDKVATRNQEMLRIKLNAGNCMRLLNEYKTDLHRVIERKKQQDADVGAKQALIKQLDDRLAETRRRLAIDGRNLQVLRQKEIGAQDGPQGIDYLSLKVIQQTLEKAVKETKRKISIKEREIQNISSGAK